MGLQCVWSVCVGDCLAHQLTSHLAHNTPLVGEVPGAFPIGGEETWGSLSVVAMLWLRLHWRNYKRRDRQPSCACLIYSKDVSLTAISISKCSHLLRSMHKILALTAAQACCTRASKGPLAHCHRGIRGVEWRVGVALS